MMGALDGNNSLKQFIKEATPTDPLQFESDYFISPVSVDQFKDEVAHWHKKPGNVPVSPTKPLDTFHNH